MTNSWRNCATFIGTQSGEGWFRNQRIGHGPASGIIRRAHAALWKSNPTGPPRNEAGNCPIGCATESQLQPTPQSSSHLHPQMRVKMRVEMWVPPVPRPWGPGRMTQPLSIHPEVEHRQRARKASDFVIGRSVVVQPPALSNGHTRNRRNRIQPDRRAMRLAITRVAQQSNACFRRLPGPQKRGTGGTLN